MDGLRLKVEPCRDEQMCGLVYLPAATLLQSLLERSRLKHSAVVLDQQVELS